jgi:hypothetical protein
MNHRIITWLAVSLAICFATALSITFLDYLGADSLDKLESVDPNFPSDLGITDCIGLVAGVVISLPLYTLKSFFIFYCCGIDPRTFTWGGTRSLVGAGFDIIVGLLLGLLLQAAFFVSSYAVRQIMRSSFRREARGTEFR